MPERDFEKKVQQVMEPFQLAPDARLFPAILDQVRQRRKRRRRLFWLWLPILLLPACFYWMYQSAGRMDPQVQQAQAASVARQPATQISVANTSEQTEKSGIAGRESVVDHNPDVHPSILPSAQSAGAAGVPASVLHNRQAPVRK